MIQLILYIAFALCVVAVGIATVAYRYRHLQDQLLYYPQQGDEPREYLEHPRDFGIEKSESVTITTNDGVKLRGFLMSPSRLVAEYTLVYLHGNAGNVAHRLPIARFLLNHLHCNVFMVDYRGYGLSENVAPTEAGLKIDGQAILDYTLHFISNDSVFVLGTSLGGALAIHLASLPQYRELISGVVVENSFANISMMVDALFTPLVRERFPRAHRVVHPILKYLVKPLVLCIWWNSLKEIREVSCPLLFLTGLKDELVPPTHSQLLFDAAKSTRMKRSVKFATGMHNDLCSKDGYCESISDFVRDVRVSRIGAQDIV